MAKEDLSLQVEMGKLEIEPVKPKLQTNDNNPFIHQKHGRCIFTRTSTHFKCPCTLPKRNISPAISKKKSYKILKEPVLRLLQNNVNKDEGKTEYQQSNRKQSSTQTFNSDVLNLCALVDNCNQLRISAYSTNNETSREECNNHTKWWKNDISHARPDKKSVAETNHAGSCSQQALNPACDVTIDELASYFETLVHIPKKMSSMAEMMYI